MNIYFKNTLLSATVLSIAGTAPAWAQDSGAASDNDIIVTARRVEERLQDVPISITVFNQKTLDENNITTARDVASYTPGLTALSRNGNDQTAFAIRGFVQERFTTATVGTYFADVVAPRGSGATYGGDGAGPGALFDLQNVQVLKGPQGTLFGRNSTGGAVLLVPQKPVDRVEGYVEGSVGDYELRRIQAVANVPVSDEFRLRAGFDYNKRDGFLKDIGNLGTGPHGDGLGSTDYIAVRVSAVADLAPNFENYTIVSYLDSKNTSSPPVLGGCTYNQNGVAVFVDPVTRLPLNGSTAPVTPYVLATIQASEQACQQIVRQSASPWTTSNPLPSAASEIEQWQVINTTTWEVSDNLTIKNIFSYAEFRQLQNQDFFGTYFPIAGLTAGQVDGPEDVTSFVWSNSDFITGHNNAQSSLVEELQFQGRFADGRLQWQAGLYFEESKPLGITGTQSNQVFTACADVFNDVCTPFTVGTSLGGGSFQRSKATFRGKAAYAQASYDLTDQLKFTAGLRYTDDFVKSEIQIASLSYTAAGKFARCSNPTAPDFGAPFPIGERFVRCRQNISNSSSAPTWLLGIDYKPIDEVLLYAKWSRGYRQGGIGIAAPDTLQEYGAEQVDTYEIGAKANWQGPVPGTFNISGFYNDFQDQQLQIGVDCIPDATHTCSGATLTTTVANIGTSRLYGFEAELGLSPFEGLRLHATYAYLNTKILSTTPFTLPPDSIYNRVRDVAVGDVIPNALPHKVVATAEYTLPLPDTWGRLSIGGTFVYQSSYRVSTEASPGTRFGILPSVNYANVNATWADVGGAPIDASFFMTNITNEVIRLHVNEQSTRGFVSYQLAEPRMWGMRLRYKFGN